MCTISISHVHVRYNETAILVSAKCLVTAGKSDLYQKSLDKCSHLAILPGAPSTIMISMTICMSGKWKYTLELYCNNMDLHVYNIKYEMVNMSS